MDVSNKRCYVGVQKNVAITYNVELPVRSSTHRKGKDFHLNKSVESFSGRDQELQQLNTWLGTRSKNMAVISGLPGYGKTELAIHFAQQCKRAQQVHSVLWLDAESAEILEQSFRELLRWLGAGDRADLDVRSVVQDVYAHFSTGPHLFIFDNAPDRRSIEVFLRDSSGLCLFTSHVQDWGDDVQSLSLEPLSMAASLDVLRVVLLQRFQENDVELYQQFAELLSRVPLALQVAAAFLRQEMLDLGEEFKLSTFITEFGSYLHINFPQFSPISYKNTIYESLSKAILKIERKNDDISKLSLSILHNLAFLNHNHIFLSDIQKFPYLVKLSDNKKILKALSLIQNFSFIRIINKNILIHKLVQEVLIFYQSHLTKGIHNSYYISCLEYLSSVYPTIHSHSIFESINKHMISFNIFYKDNESNITSTNTFVYNLIETNCMIILNIILDNVGPCRAVNVINTCCLLHRAVLRRQQDVLEQLLARGASLEQRDENEDTALLVAAWNLNLPAMKLLTSHNADANAHGRDGVSVLHYTVGASGFPQHVDKSEEAVEAVRWLVERGARVHALRQKGETLVHTAALFHSPHMISFLVKEFDLDVNAVEINQETPLHYISAGVSNAGAERILRTAQCLLSLDARVNNVNVWSRTPIDQAREQGLNYLANFLQEPSENILSYIPQTYDFAGMLKAAVAAGDVDSLSQQLNDLKERAVEVADTCNLLHIAVQHGQEDALELLLERGVDVNRRNDNNEPVLTIAAFNLDLPSMEILIKHNPDVNAVGSFEKYVLHSLIEGAGYPEGAGREADVCEMLRRLVSLGARTDAVMSSGHTIIHRAALSLRAALVRYVVTELQVDVNAVDKKKCTALHWVSEGLRHYQAEEERGIETARCLLELGACRDALNTFGDSPSQVARCFRYWKLATVLDVEDTESGSASSDGDSEYGHQVEDTKSGSASADGDSEGGQQEEDTERGNASGDGDREDGQQVEDAGSERVPAMLVEVLTSWFLELWTR